MTNKEILQSSLLDILFEHRNRDYGAYVLRRDYNKRLLLALVAGLLLVGLFVFLGSLDKKQAVIASRERKPGIEIRELVIPEVKIKEPEALPKKVPQKAIEKIASVKLTNHIAIKEDKVVKEVMPSQADMNGKEIGVEKIAGKEADGMQKPPEAPVAGTGAGTPGPAELQPDFTANEKDPEFPGGPAALQKFLLRNLKTPGELTEGEKKIVKVKFKVDKDGSVNSLEIMSSGGPEFDNEVVRVCSKMPRWIPASQNGINVPVNYVIPITFIGTE